MSTRIENVNSNCFFDRCPNRHIGRLAQWQIVLLDTLSNGVPKSRSNGTAKIEFLHSFVAVIYDVNIALVVAGERPGCFKAAGINALLTPDVEKLKATQIEDLNSVIPAIRYEYRTTQGMI